MNITFNGVWRMDWGFGNPNITAALILGLLLVAWLPAFLYRCGFWFSLPASILLGFCLIHTMSRGSILGGGIGVGTLIWFAKRPWPRSRIVAVAVGLWFAIAGAIFIKAHERLAQGISREDKSIVNRLVIWQSFPEMLAANPQGWGLSQSGQAYMDWFQPIDRDEQYGSLVNTHLSKLVELGLVGGSFYIFLWNLALILSFPTQESRWRAVPFATLIAFGIAAMFTNMARAPLVWIVPVCCLLSAIIDRTARRAKPNLTLTMIAAAFSVGIMLFFYICGIRSTPSLEVVNKIIFIGSQKPQLWIVADRIKLGNTYPKALRRFIATHTPLSIAIVEHAEDLPETILSPIIVGKDLSLEERKAFFEKAKEMSTFISPNFSPTELPEPTSARAVIGEFSASWHAASWKSRTKCIILQGVGDYIPNWTGIIENSMKEKKTH